MGYKDPENAREARRRWVEANPDKVREQQRRYREKDPERSRARNRRWREANPDRARESDRARAQRWRAAHPERARENDRRAAAAARASGRKRGTTPAQTLKRKYGLSLEQWAQLLAEQGGRCYLCGEPMDLENKRNIHVDHDHSCCLGEISCGRCIRGLACACCNPGIAMFGDDPDRMERAAAALRAANAKVAARMAAKLVQAELFELNEKSA